MIFVTVGSQLPFDRLIVAIDEWAALNTETRVVVQAGKSNFVSKHCQIKNYINPHEWGQLVSDADLIIGHAGMGTILNCIDLNKPLVIMPREFKLGEIRNDHQIATVSYFKDIPGIYIANDKDSLHKSINTIFEGGCRPASIESKNLGMLIDELRRFVKN